MKSYLNAYQSSFVNYNQKVNKQSLQTNPSFGNNAVTKVIPTAVGAAAAAATAVTAGTVLAMQNGGVKTKPEEYSTLYGPVYYTPGSVTQKPTLLVSRPNGTKFNVFENIPREVLSSPVINSIHQIQASTINPDVGIVIIQNQSKPVTARKISTEGTLEKSLVENNKNNIPLKYDVQRGTQYTDTPWAPGRQDITGNCLQVTYGTVKEDWGALPSYIAEYADPATGEAPDIGTLAAQKGTEDRLFMPADIAGKQYEIVTETGERIPCDYESMVPGVDYKISKKAGVELKMAVPPTDVISSEGETLPADKLYMVDSAGHFYNGNPIKRIKSGEVTWNADMTDPAQKAIRGYIDEALKLEKEAAEAKKAGNKELATSLSNEAKMVTKKAEVAMTDWVRTAQNQKGASFFE